MVRFTYHVERKNYLLDSAAYQSINTPWVLRLSAPRSAAAYATHLHQPHRLFLMPISGPSSYLPTVGEFLDHWEDVNNTLLAQGPLILRKETLGLAADVTRASLQILYNTLLGQHQTVQSSVVGLDLARGALEEVKEALLAKLNMFNERVRALLGNTKWERSLPEIPQISLGQGAFTDPLNGMVTLWDRIDSQNVLGVGVDLVLRDGTVYDEFAELLVTLDPAYRALSRAERTLKLEREERNDLQERIYPILKQYRVAVPGYFAAGSAMMEALPRLTPEPGHTPEPVNASIIWDAPAAQARIDWEASADEALAHYQVRYSPGTTYHEDEEDVLATFAPDDPRVFLTDHALTQPGATALFRVYVVLQTGNQAGGSTLAVTRPAGP